MADNPAAGTASKRARGAGKPFARGQSGNPSGRPAGTRAAFYAGFDKAAAEALPDVIAAIVAKAKEGDARAAELLFRRAWPEPKGRRLALELPPIHTPADLDIATANLSEAMGEGRITPDEAVQVSAVLDARRRAFETIDLAAVVQELQDRVAALSGGRTIGASRRVGDEEPDAD